MDLNHQSPMLRTGALILPPFHMQYYLISAVCQQLNMFMEEDHGIEPSTREVGPVFKTGS